MQTQRITYSTVYSPGQVDDQASEDFETFLGGFRAGPPLECPNLVEGRRVATDVSRNREDPCAPDRVVSLGYEATPTLIDQAVRAGRRAAREWGATPLQVRCDAMTAAAERISNRRIEFAALMSLEVGKTRADTLAEIDECVVILELFVEQMLAKQGYEVPMKPAASGARCDVTYRPYGLFGVIAPFNFPLALATGMAAGALITGNSVLLKPSALTPASTMAWAEVFDGLLPESTLQVVHGDAEVGQLIAGADIDGLAFTGSASVGLSLAAHMTRSPFARPLIAEMGGKNPSVVTAAAGDLAAAARATAFSAFGMSGQKCVSCSRAIVLDNVYDEFVDALLSVIPTLKIGDPIERGVFTGPLIRRAAQERFERSVAVAKSDGRMLIGGDTRPKGWYAELTVVDDLPTGHPLTRQELFAPILTLTRARDLDAAIDEANAIDFGLSAGIFTSDVDEQQRFLDRIQAGIVFVNNPGGATTGVWPGSQTMAGWKASGSTGKGGFGPNYLPQFMREQSRTIYQSL